MPKKPTVNFTDEMLKILTPIVSKQFPQEGSTPVHFNTTVYRYFCEALNEKGLPQPSQNVVDPKILELRLVAARERYQRNVRKEEHNLRAPPRRRSSSQPPLPESKSRFPGVSRTLAGRIYVEPGTHYKEHAFKFDPENRRPRRPTSGRILAELNPGNGR